MPADNVTKCRVLIHCHGKAYLIRLHCPHLVRFYERIGAAGFVLPSRVSYYAHTYSVVKVRHTYSVPRTFEPATRRSRESPTHKRGRVARLSRFPPGLRCRCPIGLSTVWGQGRSTVPQPCAGYRIGTLSWGLGPGREGTAHTCTHARM